MTPSKLVPLALSSVLLLASSAIGKAGSVSATEESPKTTTYDVRQSVVLNEIPKGAKKAALWISIPDEDPAQRVLDLAVVSSPGPWKIVRDKDRGCRFLYVEVEKPKTDSLTTTVSFSLTRSAITNDLDPSTAVALPAAQRALFAEDLRIDAPHMEVTPKIRKIVKEVCGDEENPVVQAQKLLNYVAENADHYSTNPNVPKCGVGDAESCMTKGGGCCSDLHSLFISLARGAGIPARLQMGYRLQEKNVGVEVNPGYRCWAEYFISGYGWVPADIVEADAVTDPAAKMRWFTGLTERRLHLNEGREFDLPLKKNRARVNLMTIGYAEVDGKPVRVLPEGEKEAQLSRVIQFTERPRS
ncbi:MAG: transglutaminase-like domain-containing protein [Chthoniobacteraceae bacterium]